MAKELIEYTLSSFWTFCGSYLLISILVNGIVRIVNRLLRMIMVLFRGWPSSHLDADGDWINEPDSNSQNK